MLTYNRVIPNILKNVPRTLITLEKSKNHNINIVTHLQYNFVNQGNKKDKFKVVDDPKQVNKLIFNEKGKFRIFQHKNGESEIKWIMRVGTFFTVFNSFLTGAQMAYPIFGAWNMFSFSVCAGLGFLFLAVFQNLSKRTIHKIDLNNNLQTVDLIFFNPFWKPTTVTFHITQFQELQQTYFGFIRVQLTSLGKVWIKLQKNQFRNVKDYQETLDCILLGKPITNLKISQKGKGSSFI